MKCHLAVDFLKEDFPDGSATVSLGEHERTMMVIAAARSGNTELIKLALKNYDSGREGPMLLLGK